MCTEHHRLSHCLIELNGKKGYLAYLKKLVTHQSLNKTMHNKYAEKVE